MTNNPLYSRCEDAVSSVLDFELLDLKTSEY